MSYTNIDLPTDYFDTKLYTGTGSALSISGINFSPDLVWIKDRTVGFDHVLQDSVRGTTNIINSNQNYAEFTNANSITSFNSDGFTTGSYVATNNNTTPFVSWSWRGSDSSAVSNTAGSISSTVSANTTSGFSIVSWTGTGANATVGHGLGVAPSLFILKDRDDAYDWRVYVKSLGNTGAMILNSTTAFVTDSSYFNNTSPTSSVFSLGNNAGTNGSGRDYIAYCFAEVKGYSKFGSYTGNNQLNNFVYTGFKPAFVMIKVTSTTEQWCMKDNKRNTINPLDRSMFANASNSEDYNTTNHLIDFVSNGFNLKDNTSQNLTNGSGQTYIYMAFAESPFVSSKGIACTAR